MRNHQSWHCYARTLDEEAFRQLFDGVEAAACSMLLPSFMNGWKSATVRVHPLAILFRFPFEGAYVCEATLPLSEIHDLWITNPDPFDVNEEVWHPAWRLILQVCVMPRPPARPTTVATSTQTQFEQYNPPARQAVAPSGNKRFDAQREDARNHEFHDYNRAWAKAQRNLLQPEKERARRAAAEAENAKHFTLAGRRRKGRRKRFVLGPSQSQPPKETKGSKPQGGAKDRQTPARVVPVAVLYRETQVLTAINVTTGALQGGYPVYTWVRPLRTEDIAPGGSHPLGPSVRIAAEPKQVIRLRAWEHEGWVALSGDGNELLLRNDQQPWATFAACVRGCLGKKASEQGWTWMFGGGLILTPSTWQGLAQADQAVARHAYGSVFIEHAETFQAHVPDEDTIVKYVVSFIDSQPNIPWGNPLVTCQHHVHPPDGRATQWREAWQAVATGLEARQRGRPWNITLPVCKLFALEKGTCGMCIRAMGPATAQVCELAQARIMQLPR